MWQRKKADKKKKKADGGGAEVGSAVCVGAVNGEHGGCC